MDNNLKSNAGTAPAQDQAKPFDDIPRAGCECGLCVEVRNPAKNRQIVRTFAFSAEQSEKQAAELQYRAARNRRAAELLAKHPEFDDLLELLSIVPVNFIKA